MLMHPRVDFPPDFYKVTIGKFLSGGASTCDPSSLTISTRKQVNDLTLLSIIPPAKEGMGMRYLQTDRSKIGEIKLGKRGQSQRLLMGPEKTRICNNNPLQHPQHPQTLQFNILPVLNLTKRDHPTSSKKQYKRGRLFIFSINYGFLYNETTIILPFFASLLPSHPSSLHLFPSPFLPSHFIPPFQFPSPSPAFPLPSQNILLT